MVELIIYKEMTVMMLHAFGESMHLATRTAHLTNLPNVLH